MATNFMAPVESQESQTGRLVALEGDLELIATHLQLLPPSPKVLVLPALVEIIKQGTDGEFKAREFVRAVHTGFVERVRIAREFLELSTVAHPRLVFMNGGSIAARTTCISEICKNLTDGDISEAETLFNGIVEDGVCGLLDPDLVVEDSDLQVENRVADGAPSEVEDTKEDPTLRAMNAADFLDRQTAILQPEYDASEDTTLPVKGLQHGMHSDENYTELPEFTPESQKHISTAQHASDIVRTVMTVAHRSNPTREESDVESPAFQSAPFNTTSSHSSARSHPMNSGTGAEDDDDYDDERYDLHSTDVPSTSPRRPLLQIRRAKSVDRFYPSNTTVQLSDVNPTSLHHTRSACDLRSRPATMDGRIETDHLPSGFYQLPRTSFVRASQTTIRKSPGLRESILSKQSNRVFVDRGTDAGTGFDDSAIRTAMTDIKDPSEPVFLLVEDLVIHFTGSTRDEAFDSVLQAYRNGDYSISPEASQFDHSPSTSPSSVNTEDPQSRPQSHVSAETDDESFGGRHEFDPYPAHTCPSNVTRWSRPKELSMTDSAVQDLEPQTPSAPPSHLENRFQDKFYDFSPTDWQNVIAVQTSLRAFLNTRFPAGETGYSQHYFPVGPEADRLWKPVWRKDESGGSEGRTVDQIIALGCEEGVERDFFSLMAGQVQKLGTKKDGLNRSGSLDLRYLISTAMQRYSTLPPGTQTSINPLSNPSFLATLLVPHLEAYLATNTDIRLLILTYSAHHLSTVIALRKIIGQDILKIGGIMNSLSSDPPSFASRPCTSAKTHLLSNEVTSSPHQRSSDRDCHANSLQSLQKQKSFYQPVKSESNVSFSKADYLLPSIATEAEITNFLSAIWMSLMEMSTFYTPEPEPARKVVEKIRGEIYRETRATPSPLHATLISRCSGERLKRDQDF